MRNRSVRLQCSGRVKRPFGGAQPHVSFGAVKRSMPFVKKTIKLTRGDGGPIRPEIGSIDRPGIAAELRTIREGREYELDVTLTPPWPNRRINTFFPIRTGVPQAPVDHVRVAADVEPRLRTSPSRFKVPLYQGASASSVSVFWSEGAVSRITEATPTDRRLTARVEEIGGRQAVVLNVPDGYVPGRRSVAVTLRTTDREIPAFSVPIRFDQSGRFSRRKSRAR